MDSLGNSSLSQWPKNLDHIKRIPKRVLGDISHYVTETLPKLPMRFNKETKIKKIQAKINQLVDAAYPIQFSDLNTCDIKLARLDLLMLSYGMKYRNIPIPTKLEQLINAISAKRGLSPELRYEDIILNNPLRSDPRIFHSGQTGKLEYNLLCVYQKIEQSFAHTISVLNAILQMAKRALAGNTLDHAQAQKICSAIEQIVPEIKTIEALFLMLQEISPFMSTSLKAYFLSEHNKGYFGPIYKHSAKMYHLRILLDGDQIASINPNFYDDLFAHYHCFYRQDLDNMIKIIRPEFCKHYETHRKENPLNGFYNTNLNNTYGPHTFNQLAYLPPFNDTVLKNQLNTFKNVLDTIVHINSSLVDHYYKATRRKQRSSSIRLKFAKSKRANNPLYAKHYPHKKTRHMSL